MYRGPHRVWALSKIPKPVTLKKAKTKHTRTRVRAKKKATPISDDSESPERAPKPKQRATAGRDVTPLDIASALSLDAV